MLTTTMIRLVVHLNAVIFGCSGGRRQSNTATVTMMTLLMAVNQINNQQMTRIGGAGRGLRGDDMTRDEDTQTTMKQITRRGGLDGDKDDEDHDDDDNGGSGGGHDNDDGDNNVGRWGGQDGHHRMRKGIEHNNRQ